MSTLGRGLAASGQLDREIIAQLARPEILPPWRLGFYRTMKALGIADKSWNSMMKENGCWAECFDRPHAGSPEDADDRA